MARNRPPRKSYRPRPAYANAHQIAMAKVYTLQRQLLDVQIDIMALAIDEFVRGVDCAERWKHLADTANVAEQLTAIGIGSGPQAIRVIHAAQHALANVAQRWRERGSWTLYAAELDALQWLKSLHREQLSRCSHGEFERAMDAAHTKVSQARAGNAPAGAVIVDGEIN